MEFISPDELLPTAREYAEPGLEAYGLAAGMAVMAVSLLLVPVASPRKGPGTFS